MPNRREPFAILDYDPWFARQPDAFRAALIDHAQTVAVEPGRWIYDEGEDARGLYGVLAGSVSIYVRIEDEEPLFVNIVGAGHIFGYAPGFVGGRRMTTAVTREKGTLFFVPQRDLIAISQSMPEIWQKLAELSSAYLAIAFRFAAANREPAQSRIASYLLLLLVHFGPEPRVPVGQSELAELTGLTRKTVNRTLAALAQAGYVRLSYRSIEILDQDGLRALQRRSDD